MASPLEIFCCYAREDQEMLEQLKIHLMSLQRSGQVTVWSDANLGAGAEWEKELHQHLESADIILLLISPDFMASDYCYSTEMGRAIERHRQGSVHVIPLLLRPVYWGDAPFAYLQIIPTNAKPVTQWSSRDDAFFDIVKHIHQVITDIRIQYTLLEASEYTKAIDYQEALICYEHILSLDQTNGSALFGKARTLFLSGQIDASIEAFTLAEQIAPTAGDNFFSQFFKAHAFNQRERYPESLAAYNHALDLDPNHADIHVDKASIFIKQKEYEQALSAFEQAQRLKPDKAEYITQAGDLLFRLRRYEQALVMYERAGRLQPGEASHYSWQGQILLRLQRHNKALVAYQQALSLTPQVEYYKMAGEMLLELAQSQEALILYEQGIQAINEPHSLLYAGKGQALFQLGRYEEAIDCYQRAIKLDPSHTSQQFYHQLSLLHDRLARRAADEASRLEASKRSPFIMFQKTESPFLVPPPAFDPTRLALLRTLDEHRSEVLSLAISFNTLVTGGLYDTASTIRCWDLSTGREKHYFDYLSSVWSLAVNREGTIIASGSSDGIIKLWEPPGKELCLLEGHTETVYGIAISPDGKNLVSGSTDRTIKLWELPSGRLLRTLTGHSEGVTSLSISPDGKNLVSGSTDRTIKLWELPSGRLLRTLTGHSEGVTSLSISPDGKTFASGSTDKTIKLWELPSGRELQTLTGHTYRITSLSINRKGKILASGSIDEIIKLWELPSGRELRTLIGHRGDINCIAFSSSRDILASGSDDHTIKLWGMEQ